MYSLSIRIGEFGEQNWRKINNIKYSTILIHYIFITFDWLDLFPNLKVRKALKQGIQFSLNWSWIELKHFITLLICQYDKFFHKCKKEKQT